MKCNLPDREGFGTMEERCERTKTVHFHALGIEECLGEVDSDRQGLSDEEAQNRIGQCGKNVLPQKPPKAIWQLYLSQFKSPLIYILLVAALVSYMVGEMSDGHFILAALLINAAIGAYQEYSAEQKAQSLKKAVKTISLVLRSGSKVEISSEDVTIGDLVYLESGTKIPADMRLIETNDLRIDESLLTGESLEVSKDADFVSNDEKLSVSDRKNMVYAGTHAAYGRGIGVVTHIGIDTQIGSIASLLAESQGGVPPLVTRVEQFSLFFTKVIVAIVVVLVVLGVIREMEIREIFLLSVALAVAAIPEGLPVAITVALTVSSMVMSKRNVIVQKLSAMEGLGSCTAILSDKTGTLTLNQLSVHSFITPEHIYADDEPVDDIVYKAAILCNESSQKLEDGRTIFVGDQVDIALARYAMQGGSEYGLLPQKYRKVAMMPYESKNGYSAVSYEMEGQIHHFIKGSPEAVMQYMDLGDQQKEQLHKSVAQWAEKGYRIIALGHKIDLNRSISLQDFEYLGLAVMIDPLRPEARDSIQSAQEAGINVMIVTGDHPGTAFSIAKEVGIAENESEVMTGRELELWEERGGSVEEIGRKKVFARVSPAQKQKLVTLFQEMGNYVAVTGDGVNDAPALKYANIGVAMGKAGTDVARENSDLILIDDNFKSLVDGVKEGRVSYDNIRKIIFLMVSTGVAEIILIMTSMFLALPLPLLPLQLLWLNLIAEGLQTISLAFEKAEPDILKRKPRSPDEPIFNAIMVRRILVSGVYMGFVAFGTFYLLTQLGYSVDQARNSTLLLMVLFENLHVINARSETYSLGRINHFSNHFLIATIFLTQGLHILCMHIPFMQKTLHIEPVDIHLWLGLLLLSVGLVVIMEIDKWLAKKKLYGI